MNISTKGMNKEFRPETDKKKSMGADKFLARPSRKRANVSVRMA